MNGKNRLGQKYQEKWDDSENHAPMVEKENSQPNPMSKTDDHVRHIFREHNHEADHWAKVGAEVQKKVVIDK